MAQLNHDAGGFLVGPRLTDDLDKISRELELLRAIRGDTEQTVEQLGRLVDALSGLDAVSPAEPNRPPLSPRGSDERLARAVTPALPGAGSGAPLVPPGAPTLSLSLAPTDLAPLVAANAPATPRVSPPATPRARDESGRFAPAAAPQSLPLVTRAPVIADPAVARNERDKNEQKRGSNGRFGSSDTADSDKSGESRTAKAMGAASESLKNAADGLASGADNIDPAVSAAKELGGIVAPVINTIKPLGRLFGRGRSPEEKRQKQSVVWYRRIWGELREGNKKSGGRGMGLLLTGLMSMLGMLLGPLRAFARMTGLLRALGGLGALAKGLGGLRGARGGSAGRTGKAGRGARGADAPNRRGAISERGRRTAEANRVRRNPETGRFESQSSTRPGRDVQSARTGQAGKGKPGASAVSERPARLRSSRAARVATGAAKAGKGLLRKIPILGALLGAGMFASAAMAKDDPNDSDEDRKANKADRWGTMGGVAGGLLGSVLGLVGGPAGAIAGGMLGDQLGTAVGEWLSTVDMTGMMADISSAWTTVADGASKMAGDAFGAVKDGWNSLVTLGGGVFSSLGDWAKETWGKVADTFNTVKDKIVDTFNDTKAKIVEAYNGAKDTVNDKVQTAKDYVGEKAATVKDAGQNALNTVTGGRYTGGSNARKDELIKAMDAGGITDPQSKAALMANVDHESGGFKAKEENLNYSAKRLQEVFPKYYKDAESARGDAGNPEAIANKVYGGRMGNTDPGDGFKFRGRGDIQLTGKDQYAAMGKKLGIDLVNNPELANDPKYSAQIAVEHWKSSGANALAAKGDIAGARVKTNGGTNGMADVNAKYDQYLAQAKAGDLTPTRQANEVRVPPPVAANDAINRTLSVVKGQPATGPLAWPTAGTPVNAAPGVGAGAGVPSTPTPLQTGPTKLSQAQPIGVLPIPSAAAPVPVSANPGSVQAKAPSMMMSTAAPAAIAPLQVPSYSAPAPDASQARISPTPQVAKPMMTPSKAPSPTAGQVATPLTQNLADRAIAHAATGGIGMGGAARL